MARIPTPSPKDYWPNADEQGKCGEKPNNLTKFVASSKLEDPLRLLSRRDRDATPASSTKSKMLVCPTSRGKGTLIFEDWQDLELVEATSFENSVALVRYEIKK